MDSKQLNEVAELRSGYPFRKRLNPVAEGGCRVVQMKDVDVAGRLREEHFARIEPPESYENHLLRAGDVLVAGRGAENRAVTYHAQSEKTIAAANLFVLRPRSSVLPEYLTWYLNLPKIQTELKGRRVGSSIPFLPLGELGTLSVQIPPIDLQKKLVSIYQMSLREEDLLARIRELRRTLVDGVLGQALIAEATNKTI